MGGVQYLSVPGDLKQKKLLIQFHYTRLARYCVVSCGTAQTTLNQSANTNHDGYRFLGDGVHLYLYVRMYILIRTGCVNI